MPSTPVATHPLHATAEQADALSEWMTVRAGIPADAEGWTRCADVDPAFLGAWETQIADDLLREHGRNHPMTISGYALEWYAGIPGQVGGAFFRLARRVPRLDRASLAFAVDPEAHYPVALAVLDDRFWCLPTDPAADHPTATVVEDERALAEVLRSEVRSHADAFLDGYRPRARLPRRSLLGAFADGLDTGIWYGGDPEVAAAEQVLGDAVLALPGDTAQFREPSSIYRLTDLRGREHLSRRRIGCCFYFKVSSSGLPCSTCPRVDDAERIQRYSEIDDEG